MLPSTYHHTWIVISYTLAEYCGAVLVSAGLALFTLADSQLSPDFNVMGT
jgi:hypothetical protein